MSPEKQVPRPPPDDLTLLARIRFFIAEAADRSLEDIGPDTDIYADLGIDSLGVTAVFIDMAYEFGIPEPDSNTDFATLNTATKLTHYVRTICT